MKNRKILQTVGAGVGVLVIGFSLPLSACTPVKPSCPSGFQESEKLSITESYSTPGEAVSACIKNAENTKQKVLCLADKASNCTYGAIACIQE